MIRHVVKAAGHPRRLLKLWQCLPFPFEQSIPIMIKTISLRLTPLRPVALVLALFSLGMFANLAARPIPVDAADPHAPNQNVKITVTVSKPLGKVPLQPLGLGMYSYGNSRPEPSYLIRTAEGMAKLTQLGIQGNYYLADRNDWRNPYDPFTAQLFPPSDVMYTDEFLNANSTIGAAPILSINVTNLCHQTDSTLPPSSSNVTCQRTTPALTVSWLKYVKQLGKKVDFVAIGVEPYSGCPYWIRGINCTTNRGEHKIALPQEEYAQNIIKWARKLRKVFPDLKIGAQLQPNTYLCRASPALTPDAADTDAMILSGPKAVAQCGKSWDQTVLEKAGGTIDFVLAHQYFWIASPVTDEATAQRMSYYEEQVDSRVATNGVTAMPASLRQEIVQWLPNNPNIPIVYSEFNAASGYLLNGADAIYAMRQSLFTGISLGELYLDMLLPVKVGGQTFNGADRNILHGFFSQALTLARFPTPVTDPSTLIYMPSWHIMRALVPFAGKTWVKVKIGADPQTAVNRPALSAYAVKSGKQVWLAVFNHDEQPVLTNIQIKGLLLKSGKVTRIGHNAASFLSQNDPLNPTAIEPEVGTLTMGTPETNRISGFSFAAHSFTLFEITGQ